MGLGTWAIGGGNWAGGWGPQDDAASRRAILRALELGVNWIDTAPAYGLGHAETVVGQAVREWVASGGPAPYIFSKVAIKWRSDRSLYNSLQAASVRREVQDSLLRLGVERLDLAQIHWPDPEAEIEEGWATLAALKAEGLVAHIGVSNFSVAQIERLQPIAPVETLQPPFSLARRDAARELLPYCQARRLGVIVYSPLQSGLLSGAMTRARAAAFPEDDHRRNEPEFQPPLVQQWLDAVARMEAWAAHRGYNVAQAAVAWTLAHPAVTGAIVGARDAEQVQGWIDAARWRLGPASAGQLAALATL